ncbi:MAG: hypothetical protein ACI90V_011187, partial [Bacillariaceae sp.]
MLIDNDLASIGPARMSRIAEQEKKKVIQDIRWSM